MSLFSARRNPELPPVHPPTLPSDNDFQKGLRWSLGLHLSAILLIGSDPEPAAAPVPGVTADTSQGPL